MFDIGFLELLIIGVLSLLVMGPERLPGAIRTTTVWIARLRRSFQQIKSEIEREVGADEIKQQIHNESIMQSLQDTKNEIEENLKEVANEVQPGLEHLQYDINGIVNKNTEDNSTDSTANSTENSTINEQEPAPKPTGKPAEE